MILCVPQSTTSTDFDNGVISTSDDKIRGLLHDTDWFGVGGDTVSHVTKMTNQMKSSIQVPSHNA